MEDNLAEEENNGNENEILVVENYMNPPYIERLNSVLIYMGSQQETDNQGDTYF